MKELLKNLIEQFIKIYRNINSKIIIFFCALLFSITVYVYVVNFYGQDFSILDGFSFTEKKYNFYSGNKKLNYFRVGEALRGEHPKNITIKNIETEGSFDNAESIVTDHNPSIGLAVKSMIDKDEIINEQLEFVSPIFFDRLYIIFNNKLLDKGSEKLNEEAIEISPNTDPKILELFAKAKINIGPVGSGTKLISNFIITELNKQIDQAKIPRTYQHIDTASSGETINKLKNGKLDIGFFMTGCLSDDLRDLFNGNRFGLVGIDSSMVNLLNNEKNLDLKINKYKEDNLVDAKNNMTLSAYVYLIADKRIPSTDIMEIISSLSKSQILCGNQELLNDFKFFEYYKKKSENKYILSLRNVLLFITTVFTSFAIAFISLSYFVSFTRQNHYLKQISYVVNRIPNNSELQSETHENTTALINPLIAPDQIPIINNIIIGMQRLIVLRKELSDETGLNDQHFDFIQNRIDQIMEKLRKSLYIRLNELKERGEFITSDISKDTIRKYFTADWITDEAYRKLIDGT